MALFEACSKQFVKDTGRTTLHYVIDLNSSSRSNILCVVTKKKSRWFWKPIKYSSTPFALNQLLTKPVDVSSQIVKSTFIAKYKNEPKFQVSGKLGTKIASEFGIDVSTTDSFTVSMDIGTVMKKEVGWEDLQHALSDNTFNLDHEFMQYILSKRRRSLCVIYESVTTCGDADLDSQSNEEGDASVNAGKPKFSINLSGKVQETHHRSFELPSNTVLGFACYELTFDSVMGGLELVLDDVADAGDSGVKHLVFDEPDGQKDRALHAVFDDLLKSPLYSQIVGCFRKILSFPAAILPLRDLLEEALSSSEEEKQEPSLIADLKTSAGEGYESCKDLLSLVGFVLEETGDGKITLPKESSAGLLKCCTGLTEALVELSAAQCLALQQVTSQYLEPLLYLLKNAMYGNSTPADDPQLQRVWTHSSNPAKQFLMASGFEHVTEDNKKVLRMKADIEDTFLEDCYVSVFVLCAA